MIYCNGLYYERTLYIEPIVIEQVRDVCKGLAGDLGEAADNSYPFDIMSSL